MSFSVIPCKIYYHDQSLMIVICFCFFCIYFYLCILVTIPANWTAQRIRRIKDLMQNEYLGFKEYFYGENTFMKISVPVWFISTDNE